MMKEELQDKIDAICDYAKQWAKGIITVIFAPIFITWTIFEILIHPIIWAWTFFQCQFIINYYVRRKYCNLEYNTLLRYNINLNYPSRQENTLQNRIYRWCTFKIFERNNYTYDPNRKASYCTKQ